MLNVNNKETHQAAVVTRERYSALCDIIKGYIIYIFFFNQASKRTREKIFLISEKFIDGQETHVIVRNPWYSNISIIYTFIHILCIFCNERKRLSTTNTQAQQFHRPSQIHQCAYKCTQWRRLRAVVTCAGSREGICVESPKKYKPGFALKSCFRLR